MRAVCDSAPLISAARDQDGAHALARDLLAVLGRDALVPEPVLVEVDQMLRRWATPRQARGLMRAAAQGWFTVVYTSPNILRRAVQIDAQYADLNLGLVDATVMAVAERERLPIFTFDFRDFRAAPPLDGGTWDLLVEEATLHRSLQHRDI